MANLKTICAFLRIGTMLLVMFDKDGKFAVLVDLLQEVQEKLCGGSLFAYAPVPRAENAQRQSAADYIVESLKAACDCDDCECGE